MNIIPCLMGLALWAGATLLLTADALEAGHLTIDHALQPLLTAGTVAAAVWVHKARWIAKPAFLLLAIIASVATVYATLGRQAAAKDNNEAETQAVNRTYGDRTAELRAAKVEQAKECRTIGKRCEAWNSRVDKLSGELSGLVVKSTDPRADAIARLATLFGGNGAAMREIVAALDPILLPVWLELGSIVFFAVAFPHRRRASVKPLPIIAEPCSAILTRAFTKGDALRDFRKLGEAGSGIELSRRWHVHPATVSRWLSEWKAEGAINRHRDGKAVRAVLALPAPRR